MPASSTSSALLALFLSASCGADARTQAPLTELPRIVTPAERDLAEASIDFGIELLRHVRAESDEPNVVLSPLSISLALGLALNGARAQTFDALRAGLQLPEESLESLNSGYRGLRELLGELDHGTQLDIANAIFPERRIQLLPDYLERAKGVFAAQVQPLDFASATAKDEINGWVKSTTRGRIESIVQRIRPEEILFLVNVVYFKGDWTKPFDPERTRPQSFMLADGKVVEVPMMNHGPAETRYLLNDDVEAIELPYGRGAYTLVVMLPRTENGLDALIERLDGKTWSRWMGEFTVQRPSILLPRLKVEFSTSLGDALRALGMEPAFQPGTADFSGLTAHGEGQVYISRVDHRTHLEVDEKGTTAAAATSVAIGLVSMGPEFAADRPFLLAIRERFTGTLLFLGTIGDPRQD